MITSRRKVVDPLEVIEACLVLAGDLLGSVARSGIHDDDFIDDLFQREQARLQKPFLVLDDQGGGKKHVE